MNKKELIENSSYQTIDDKLAPVPVYHALRGLDFRGLVASGENFSYELKKLQTFGNYDNQAVIMNF